MEPKEAYREFKQRKTDTLAEIEMVIAAIDAGSLDKRIMIGFHARLESLYMFLGELEYKIYQIEN